MEESRITRCVLFDWGDTLMRVFPEYSGRMDLWPQVEAMPGAREILAALHPHWTLALATNAQDSNEAEIWAALRRASLDTFLDRVFCYRSLGYKKPSREFFLHALKELRVAPNHAVMVGDEFDVDIAGALGAGLRAVWFNPSTPERRDGPMFRTIGDLVELEPLLRDWI